MLIRWLQRWLHHICKLHFNWIWSTLVILLWALPGWVLYFSTTTKNPASGIMTQHCPLVVIQRMCFSYEERLQYDCERTVPHTHALSKYAHYSVLLFRAYLTQTHVCLTILMMSFNWNIYILHLINAMLLLNLTLTLTSVNKGKPFWHI